MEADITHPLLLDQMRGYLSDTSITEEVEQFLMAVDRSYHEQDSLRERLRSSVASSLERMLIRAGDRRSDESLGELEREIRQARSLLSECMSISLQRRVSSSAMEPRAATGPKTVLCVESETGLRNLTARVLTSRGYRVLEAASSARATNLAIDEHRLIDLLITEVALPDVAGFELHAKLRPHLRGPVIYVGDDPRAAGAVIRSGAIFLRKPFSIEELSDAVQQALGYWR